MPQASYTQHHTSVFVSPLLHTTCSFNRHNQIIQREERTPWERSRLMYAYDAAGHLTAVWRNERQVENYVYNTAGQRVTDFLEHVGHEREWVYADDGTLRGSMQCAYSYDPHHRSLIRRVDRRRETQWHYGRDGLPYALNTPDGRIVCYEYDTAEGVPLVRAKSTNRGELLEAFVWDRAELRLLGYADHRVGLCMDFVYGDDCAVRQIHLYGTGVSRFAPGGGTITLDCGVDHLGTLTCMRSTHRTSPRSADKRLCKRVVYDSFGQIVTETMPELFIPIGFTGGLRDRESGLVRFLFREYDPECGRFTSPDPARDLRGDGDVYDYCVDDPVSKIDCTGLAFTDADRAAGGKSHEGIPHPFGEKHGIATPSSSQKAFGSDERIRPSAELSARIQKGTCGKYGPTYSEAFDMLYKQLPDDVTQQEMDDASDILLEALDLLHTTGEAYTYVAPRLPQDLADLAAEWGLEGEMKDSLISLAATAAGKYAAKKIAPFIVGKIIGRLGIGFLFSAKEANPLTYEEKKQMREKERKSKNKNNKSSK